MLLKELEGQRKVLYGIIANFPSIFPSTLQEQGEYDSDEDDDEGEDDLTMYISVSWLYTCFRIEDDDDDDDDDYDDYDDDDDGDYDDHELLSTRLSSERIK